MKAARVWNKDIIEILNLKLDCKKEKKLDSFLPPPLFLSLFQFSMQSHWDFLRNLQLALQLFYTNVLVA